MDMFLFRKMFIFSPLAYHGTPPVHEHVFLISQLLPPNMISNLDFNLAGPLLCHDFWAKPCGPILRLWWPFGVPWVIKLFHENWFVWARHGQRLPSKHTFETQLFTMFTDQMGRTWTSIPSWWKGPRNIPAWIMGIHGPGPFLSLLKKTKVSRRPPEVMSVPVRLSDWLWSLELAVTWWNSRLVKPSCYHPMDQRFLCPSGHSQMEPTPKKHRVVSAGIMFPLFGQTCKKSFENVKTTRPWPRGCARHL